MCGITGFFNVEHAGAKTKHSLTLLAARGKEAAGVLACDITAYKHDLNPHILRSPDLLPVVESRAALGHVLHAMVGSVPQPVVGRGPNGERSALVANCEIYNWHALASEEKIANEARNDTGVLLHLLDSYPIERVLEKLDGVYAFAYLRGDTLTLARDILGVKPLWYARGPSNAFAFASEQQALSDAHHKDFSTVRELYPRSILTYHIASGEMNVHERAFLTIVPEHVDAYEMQRDHVAKLLQAAIVKRIPDAPNKYGILLSGGVDSSTIASVLVRHARATHQDLPHCYVVGSKDSSDVIAATRVAQELNLKVTILSPFDEEIARELQAIVTTVDDANPVKLSVAATFWFACAKAEKDGVRCLFSGLGSEELFAGYARHRASTEPNKECLAGLRKMHERDLYRDDVITMHHGIELRLPFLDRALVSYALKIPPRFKITTEAETDSLVDKRILRDAALMLGVPSDIALRPKKAAQYGSGIMKQLLRLAKAADTSLAAHLSVLRGKPNLVLAALLSGGKDSVLALHIMHRMQYSVACCITIESDNPDSYLYHTPNTSLAKLQAEALRIPLITARTPGVEEQELGALRHALLEAKEKYGIHGVITGAIRSQYQRERIEKLCDELGLTAFSPLWQTDQVDELRTLIAQGYDVIITKVAADGLDTSWLGKHLDEPMVKKLAALEKSHGVHPAGEGGEYESLVLDAPLFHEKLVLGRTETIKDGSAATLVIQDARLVAKPEFHED